MAELALLRRALRLWRGEPFEDVRSAWLVESQSPRLVERYLGALERRIDLDIAAGRGGDLAAELRRLTVEHPLRESLWARLLIVLDQAGQRADALRLYETIRVRIADQLGVDPGPELQRAYLDLLADRPPQPAEEAGWLAVPRQLPGMWMASRVATRR